MVKRNLAQGFSLVEALVVMTILAIFFAFAGKVITTKPKPKLQRTTHGYYECYYSGGLHQRYVLEGNETEPEAVSQCVFTPRSGTVVFNVNAKWNNGFYTGFEPNVNDNLLISGLPGSVMVKTQSYTGGATALENNNNLKTLKSYLKMAHKKSKMYNNGNVLNGIFISW